jgi:hypothetical protein
MERAMWTDERLDDLAHRVDAGFERVDTDIRELRTAVHQLWGSTIVGFLVVIATVIATKG